mmetsp:Transcript_45737/g.90778  ORF Transcript_45737/g.90778 Transcript_45737/m.90778 type:complete len:202 (+) Transcript_45737:21-626(+)
MVALAQSALRVFLRRRPDQASRNAATRIEPVRDHATSKARPKPSNRDGSSQTSTLSIRCSQPSPPASQAAVAAASSSSASEPCSQDVRHSSRGFAPSARPPEVMFPLPGFNASAPSLVRCNSPTSVTVAPTSNAHSRISNGMPPGRCCGAPVPKGCGAVRCAIMKSLQASTSRSELLLSTCWPPPRISNKQTFSPWTSTSI